MTTYKYILIALTLLFIASCSDEDFIRPSGEVCRIVSYTDSSNYIYEIEYNDNNYAIEIKSYKIDDNNEKSFQSSSKINRNFFDIVETISYYNKDNILESIDSVENNNDGSIYEITNYNNKFERVSRTTYSYNSQNQIKEKRNFRFNKTWEIKNTTTYEYDNNGNIEKSVYTLYTDNGTNTETNIYTYDNMNNLDKHIDIFTPFTTGNILTRTTEYTLGDGSKVTETKTYEHTYDENGFITQSKITSSANTNEVNYRYNTIECK